MISRRYQRVPFFHEVGLTAGKASAAAPARSFDISLGGVGVFTQAHLERGQLVQVAFHLRDARQQAFVETVAGHVAYLRASEDGNQLGIEFLEPIRVDTHPRLLRAIERL
jgi:c-di-GMP-binding flagellar brake protein YcgR